jgi:hypothetical protein
MGYFLFATLPVVLGAVMVWVLVEAIVWVRRRSPATG